MLFAIGKLVPLEARAGKLGYRRHLGASPIAFEASDRHTLSFTAVLCGARIYTSQRSTHMSTKAKRIIGWTLTALVGLFLRQIVLQHRE